MSKSFDQDLVSNEVPQEVAIQRVMRPRAALVSKWVLFLLSWSRKPAAISPALHQLDNAKRDIRIFLVYLHRTPVRMHDTGQCGRRMNVCNALMRDDMCIDWSCHSLT